MTVTPDGKHIISGAQKLAGAPSACNSRVKVWNVASKSLVSTWIGFTSWINSESWVRVVAAMPDGKRFLSGSMDGAVRVCLLNGTLKNTFRLHRDDCSIRALVALPDNQHALSASTTGQSSSSTSTTAPSCTFEHHEGCPPWRCCLTAAASSAARTTTPPASSRFGRESWGSYHKFYRTASLAPSLRRRHTTGSGREEPKERGGLAVCAHTSPSANSAAASAASSAAGAERRPRRPRLAEITPSSSSAVNLAMRSSRAAPMTAAATPK